MQPNGESEDEAGRDVREPGSCSALPRILGLGDGVAVGGGVTVAAGVLRTPGIVAGEPGSQAAVYGVWIVGAVMALTGALVLARGRSPGRPAWRCWCWPLLTVTDLLWVGRGRRGERP